MLTKTEKRTVYFTMVRHPVDGWIRVGNAYNTRKGAQSWLPFVRASWRVCKVRVSQFTIKLINGGMDERSKRVLSEKFNMDPPGESGGGAKC